MICTDSTLVGQVHYYLAYFADHPQVGGRLIEITVNAGVPRLVTPELVFVAGDALDLVYVPPPLTVLQGRLIAWLLIALPALAEDRSECKILIAYDPSWAAHPYRVTFRLHVGLNGNRRR